jgi:hypothetical protein
MGAATWGSCTLATPFNGVASERREVSERTSQEYPLRVTDLFEDLFAQERAEDRCTLGGTGGAEHSTAARERDQVVRATLVAVDAGEPSLEVAANAWNARTTSSTIPRQKP